MQPKPPFEIHPDIARAFTLPAHVYSDPAYHAAARERVFARGWQLVGDLDRVRAPGQVLPFTLLEGMLDEPLLLVRDRDDRLHCMSNVCTHRGHTVVESEGVVNGLRCRYHGRRFDLEGRCTFMPEFEDVEGFPAPTDHLPQLPLHAWGKFLFTALDPAAAFEALIAPLEARCGWMPLAEATLDPARSRDYLVQANWALYCDNYLEGFHIPYVHAALSDTLDYGRYRTECFEWANLQVGVAQEGEDVFELPTSSPDHGQQIGAYYFFLFPNTMINVYPWGISVNIVRPLAVDRTRVSFLSYVWDASRLNRGAGAALDRVEREDEVIVENVQRGVGGRLYDRGRYSPLREPCVHHFHRLLARALHG